MLLHGQTHLLASLHQQNRPTWRQKDPPLSATTAQVTDWRMAHLHLRSPSNEQQDLHDCAKPVHVRHLLPSTVYVQHESCTAVEHFRRQASEPEWTQPPQGGLPHSGSGHLPGKSSSVCAIVVIVVGFCWLSPSWLEGRHDLIATHCTHFLRAEPSWHHFQCRNHCQCQQLR